MLHYFLIGYKKEIFPFIGLLGIFLMLSFAFPPFFIRVSNYQLGTLSVQSMKWSFYGYAFFYLFYYIYVHLFAIKLKPFDPIKTDLRNTVVRLNALIFMLFWVSDKFLLSNTSIHHIALVGIYIYIGTYLILINKKIHLSPIEKYLFYVIFLYEYVNRMFDGLLVLIAMFTLFLVLVDFYSRRSYGRLVVFAIPFVFTFIILSPVKSEFREIVWFSDRAFNTVERFNTITELYNDYLSDKKVVTYKSDYDEDRNNFFWRYSYQASAFSLAIEETPANVPFWEGESYVLFSKFIPRFLWPDKPKEDMGYKFGTRYGIIDMSNTNTSMNTPILTEMYINFGYTGIILCMSVLAFVYAVMNSFFNNIKTSTIGKVYCIAFLFPFVIHESNFTLVFGNIPLMLIAIYSISGLLKGRAHEK